jgi:hypothetical protein
MRLRENGNSGRARFTYVVDGHRAGRHVIVVPNGTTVAVADPQGTILTQRTRPHLRRQQESSGRRPKRSDRHRCPETSRTKLTGWSRLAGQSILQGSACRCERLGEVCELGQDESGDGEKDQYEDDDRHDEEDAAGGLLSMSVAGKAMTLGGGAALFVLDLLL